MFKILALTVALFALAACGEDGSYWSGDTKQVNAESVVRMEATGEDLRVYGFRPEGQKGFYCVFVAGTNKAGLDCFATPMGGGK